MAKRVSIIKNEFEIYDQISDLEVPDRLLLEKAIEVLDLSYSPYSKFKVGAALQLDNDVILTGVNQENASYPLCICAERVALYAAGVQYPTHQIKHLAITAKSNSQPLTKPVTPCGACRQVIAEFEVKQKAPMRIILMGESGEVHIFKGSEALLPFSFEGKLI